MTLFSYFSYRQLASWAAKGTLVEQDFFFLCLPHPLPSLSLSLPLLVPAGNVMSFSLFLLTARTNTSPKFFPKDLFEAVTT